MRSPFQIQLRLLFGFLLLLLAIGDVRELWCRDVAVLFGVVVGGNSFFWRGSLPTCVRGFWEGWGEAAVEWCLSARLNGLADL